MSCQSPIAAALAGLALCSALSCGVSAAELEAGQLYCFSPADFSQADSSVAGVCITGLPDSGSGRLCLGSRIIRAGDVLTAEQLEHLTFQGGSSDQATAVIRYLPILSDGIAAETAVTISLRPQKDEAPVAEDSAMETYKNLPNEALLKVTDPEGQPLVYTLTRQPRRGQVILREDGSFLYTPDKNKVGTDSFTYTATDPAGNVSREATVTVRILKPSDQLQYSDTAGLSCRFCAEWLRSAGIFSGESVSGQLCFSPEEQVTRGQFLAMLMQTLELPVDNSVTETGFVDTAPAWLKPYLAAALRSGLITGYAVEGGVEFRPEQPITGQEAAVMLQNALDFAIPTALDSSGSIAAWACESVAAVAGGGLSLPEGEDVLTRADTAQLLYAVSKLQSPLEAILSR